MAETFAQKKARIAAEEAAKADNRAPINGGSSDFEDFVNQLKTKGAVEIPLEQLLGRLAEAKAAGLSGSISGNVADLVGGEYLIVDKVYDFEVTSPVKAIPAPINGQFAIKFACTGNVLEMEDGEVSRKISLGAKSGTRANENSPLSDDDLAIFDVTGQKISVVVKGIEGQSTKYLSAVLG